MRNNTQCCHIWFLWSSALKAIWPILPALQHLNHSFIFLCDSKHIHKNWAWAIRIVHSWRLSSSLLHVWVHGQNNDEVLSGVVQTVFSDTPGQQTSLQPLQLKADHPRETWHPQLAPLVVHKAWGPPRLTTPNSSNHQHSSDSPQGDVALRGH